MSSTRILIIEDEQDVIDLLTLNLRKAGGFTLSTASDGATGLRKAREEMPALIILDLMLPKMPGLEVCKVLKSDPGTRQIPIIMLTAKAEEIDRIVGLEFGADDYVTKPFSPRELILRVNAILRRGKGETAEEKMSIGAITLDPARHRVTLRGGVCALTPREFRLLAVFMAGPGRAFTRDELVSRAFGDDYEGFDRTVDVHVAHLRRKIEDDPAAPRRIATVFGVGYRYEIVT